MKTIHLAFALLLAVLACPHPVTAAAGGASVRAILITATNQKQEADPKLDAFEAELQRNLPLSSFRYVAEGSSAITAGGHAAITLGRGHRLDLEGDKGGGGIRVKVQWFNGKSVVMNTTLTLQPGVPAVLGRRPSGDGDTPIIILIAR
ncbi:hypothetical protein [Horticoccus sp. 23ND18S-11]|uniref:hypothetical protein n=1 Tax=Horticoccus sp. 23ND18S-11 TaxID=3391832 RepID=UPI0039C9AB2D